jgi:hypothetical protein
VDVVPRARIAVVGAVLALAIGGVLLAVGDTERPAPDARDTSRPLIALLADPAPRGIPYLAQAPGLPALAGMDIAGARLAATSPTGSHLLAVESDGGRSICVVATDTVNPRSGAGSCATRESFMVEGVFAALVGPDVREVIGLLPDGVATVVATDLQGGRTTVQVRKNAIRLPLAQAATISFNLDGRPVLQDFSDTPTDI